MYMPILLVVYDFEFDYLHVYRGVSSDLRRTWTCRTYDATVARFSRFGRLATCHMPDPQRELWFLVYDKRIQSLPSWQLEHYTNRATWLQTTGGGGVT